MKRLWQKWMGGSLVYSLLISFVIALLLASMLMMRFFQQGLIDRHHQVNMARTGLKSAALQYLSLNQGRWASQAGPIFPGSSDSTWISGENWGLFKLLEVKSQYGQSQEERAGLVGQKKGWPGEAAIILTDQRYPLKVVGETRIKGDAYIPANRIEAGRVGQKGFSGTNYLEGKVNDQLHLTTDLELENLRQYMIRLKKLPFTGIVDSALEISWQDTIQKWKIPASGLPEERSYKGKILLYSDEILYLGPKHKLDGVLIMAPEIHLASGFNGRLQLFAKERIHLEPAVKLQYPSALVLALTEQPVMGQILVDSASQVEGVLCVHNGLSLHNFGAGGMIKTQAGSLVRGWMISSDAIEHRGRLEGGLWADHLLLVEKGQVFLNYLMDAEIDAYGLDDSFCGSWIWPGHEAEELMQWL